MYSTKAEQLITQPYHLLISLGLHHCIPRIWSLSVDYTLVLYSQPPVGRGVEDRWGAQGWVRRVVPFAQVMSVPVPHGLKLIWESTESSYHINQRQEGMWLYCWLHWVMASKALGDTSMTSLWVPPAPLEAVRG